MAVCRSFGFAHVLCLSIHRVGVLGDVRNLFVHGCHGVRTTQSLLFESVLEYVSLVARVDSRTQKSLRRCNGLSWFRPISALCPATDDPCTQEHSKSGVTIECTGERERFGRGLARC